MARTTHHERLAKGLPGLLSHKPKPLKIRPRRDLPKVPPGDSTANERTVDHLRTTLELGDLPKYLAADVTDRGSTGIAVVRELLGMAKAELGEDRTNELGATLFDHLMPDQQRDLLGGEPAKPMPMGVRMAEAGAGDADPAQGQAESNPPANPSGTKPAGAKPSGTKPATSPASSQAPTPKQPSARQIENDKDAFETPLVLNPEVTPDMAHRMLEGKAKAGRALGFDNAADNLEHYLHGQGKDKIIPRDETRKRDFVRQAEETNRGRFEEKFLDPTHARTGAKLAALKDGQTTDLKDNWDYIVGPIGPSEPLKKAILLRAIC